jgi:nicotinamidase-related amidase
LVAAVVRNPDHLLVGTPPTELIEGLGPEPTDLVSARLHGVSPFSGTSLDTWLRSLGVRTVVATGVSVNLGVLGLAIEAVNLGYSVVVPRDAVAGLPAEYADAVLENTFPLIATVTTTDAILDAWARSPH